MIEIPEIYKKYLDPNEEDIKFLIKYHWWHNYKKGSVDCPPPRD